jgi:hypothetical protein
MTWRERKGEEEKRYWWREEDIMAQIDGRSGNWTYTVFKDGKRHAFGVERSLVQAKYHARNIIREIGGDK